MLDVHPPHASTHTWRDFFIHIATIVLGLLIAVGLEQTVEYVHHLHQRHELEQNLHDEAMRNKVLLDRNFVAWDGEMRFFLDLKQYVDGLRTSHSQQSAHRRPQYLLDESKTAAVGWDSDRAQSEVWTSALQSQLITLLPPEEARAYGRVYLQLGVAIAAHDQANEDLRELRDLSARYADRSSPLAVDFTRMSDEALDQYSTLLARNFNRVWAEKRMYKGFYGKNAAMLNADSAHPPSEEDLHRAQIDVEDAIKDDLAARPHPPEPPGPK